MPWKELQRKINRNTFVDNNGCWVWQNRGKKYPRTSIKGIGKVSMHRASFELYNGPIPERMVVMHTCDNCKCVNPDHLQLGTYRENIKDMISKSRGVFQKSCGEKHWNCSLSEETVEKIRNASGTHEALAEFFGVNQSTITRIKNRKRRQYAL